MRITLVAEAIHNAAEPRHFMRIRALEHWVTATLGRFELARSRVPLEVREVGRDIYAPVFYFPRADVAMARLARTAKSTHCPLKGDTEYFDALLDERRVADVAWSYVRTLAAADVLAHYIAFDRSLVHVVEFIACPPPAADAP